VPGKVEVCRRLQWVDNAGSQGSEAQGLAGEDASKSWSAQSVLVESEVLGASSELGDGLESFPVESFPVVRHWVL